MQNAGQQFRTKRQQFSNQIRRQNREQILAKRRNMYAQNQKSQAQNSDSKLENLIIDTRFVDKIKQFHSMPASKQKFYQYITAFNDNDILKKHYGVIGIRKLLANSNSLNSYIQNTIDNGLVPKFIILAQQTQFPQLQLQAVWCLANIASGNSQQTAIVIQKGGIRMFVDLLLYSHPGIVQKSIWTLGNIACDAHGYRDNIIKCGGITNMVKVAEAAITQLPRNPSMAQIIQSITWSLSNICRKTPHPNYLSIKQALPVFFYVIKNNLVKDTSIIGNACWAIFYFTDRKKQGPTKIDTIQNCIDSGVVPTFVQFLGHNYDVLVVTSLKILGNIANGEAHQTQHIIKLGILDKLEVLLGRAKKVYRRQACWIISNITAGNAALVDAVITKKSLVNKLLQRITEDLPEVVIQICYIFANATEQGDKERVLAFLLQIDYLKYLIEILQNKEDTNLIYTCLQCLQSVLFFGKQVSQGKDKKENIFVKQLYKTTLPKKLQQLQQHQEQKIYQEVSRIISTYFQFEDSINFLE